MPPDPAFFFFPTPVVAGAGSNGVPSLATARGGASLFAAAQTGVTSSSMVEGLTTRGWEAIDGRRRRRMQVAVGARGVVLQVREPYAKTGVDLNHSPGNARHT